MGRRPTRILVIGGGITGLCCAHRLMSLGLEPVLVEAGERVGGRIRTVREGGFEFEAGPNTLMDSSPALNALLDELKLRDEIVPASSAARKRYVLLDGELVPIPMGPVAALTSPLLGVPGLMGLLGDVLKGRGAHIPADESIDAFIRRRFGARIMDRLVGPFLSGVYAGDPGKLEARSVFPALTEAEEQAGGVVRGLIRKRRAGRMPGQAKPPRARGISFRGGLERLPARIAEALGGRVLCGEKVVSLRKTDEGCEAVLGGGDVLTASHAVVAVETGVAAGLVRQLDGGDAVSRELGGIEASTVAVVGLAFKREQVRHPLDGFGYLVGPGNHGPMLGCLFRSSIFPESAPEGSVLLACFLGGAMHDVAPLLDMDVERIATGEIRRVLGAEGTPSRTFVYRWQNALPQANRGHTGRRTAIEQWSRRPDSRVSVISSGVYGAPLPKCIETGRAEAERLAATYGASADTASAGEEVQPCVPA